MTASQQTPPSMVFMYHRLGSPLVRSLVRTHYILPAFFRHQACSYRRLGYRMLTLAEMMDPVPQAEGCGCITFDDAYASVGQHAYPILRELDMPATVFVVAGAVGKTNLWDQQCGDRVEALMDKAILRDMADAGWDIAAHTMTHPHLTRLSDAALRQELCDAKHLLEDLIGKPVDGFAYPYGDFDARVRQAVIDAGYRYAAATTRGMVTDATDPFAIPRVNIRFDSVGPILHRKIRRTARMAGR